MMKVCFIACLTSMMCVSLPAQTQQVKMREVFAQAPDSIFALLSTNNKLDLIDFAEAGMIARVRNVLDEDVVLEVLTDDYMSLQSSADSWVEVKLLPTSHLLVNKTYSGPGLDSEVRLYDTQWTLLQVVPRPEIERFMTEQDEDVRAEASVLPLISARLSPDDCKITWTLQNMEMSKDVKQKAGNCLKSVVEDCQTL